MARDLNSFKFYCLKKGALFEIVIKKGIKWINYRLFMKFEKISLSFLNWKDLH